MRWNKVLPCQWRWAWTWDLPAQTLCLSALTACCWTRSTCARAGNPKQAVRDGLASLARRVGDRACVVAAGVTGSGRTMIGKLIGADAVRDEITAQARAARCG